MAKFKEGLQRKGHSEKLYIYEATRGRSEIGGRITLRGDSRLGVGGGEVASSTEMISCSVSISISDNCSKNQPPLETVDGLP